MNFIKVIPLLYSISFEFILQEVKYNWTVAMESAVDSSFFWGYLVTQVPGGFLASIYPANRIFGTAIAMSSFLNLLVPAAMSVHPMLVILVRASQGFVEVRIYSLYAYKLIICDKYCNPHVIFMIFFADKEKC